MKYIAPILISDGTSNGKRTSTNATDEAIPAWASGTTYASLAQVSYLHGIYESRQAANTAHTPTVGTTDSWWRYLGPLNSWAMFDTTVETQTQHADTLAFQLVMATFANGLALLNMEGKSVHVTLTDPVEGVVYDKTFSLVSTNGINNFWRWLYSPIERRKNLVIVDLPMYANATLDVVIDNTDATAKCGVCAVGLVRQIGQADYGTSRSVKSYSTIKEDEFGNRVITKRSYAKRMSAPITIDRNDIDYVTRKLEDDVRDVPVVYIASEDFEATIVFGIYESFDEVIEMWGQAKMQLVVQGLI